MRKEALSVTLDAGNVTWLKGRAGAGEARSVSELLDRLVTAARQARPAGAARSVVGTIDFDASDPALTTADSAVRALYDQSLGRPLVVRKAAVRHSARRPKRRRG
jgi:hypothetical protein